MKSKLFRHITLGVVAAGIQASVALGAAAGPEPLPIEGNPFVELYRLRVTQAELNLERQIAVEKLAAQRLERGRRLISSHAISAEEIDILTSEDSVARSDRALALKKID